ncbi:hypothetical protein RJI07_04685 [Mycoplasmatota bacterium WC30]
MAINNKDELLEVLYVKATLYALITILFLTLMIVAPKKVFTEDTPFRLATSMAITDDDNLLLYDYQVYGTEERFNDGLIYDVEEIKIAFQERNEIFLIKIYGIENTTELVDGVILITDPDIPELNIEYHLIKDMEVNNINIQCKTFIMAFNDVSILVNSIYLAIYFVFFVIILTPTIIKLSRSIIYIIKKTNQEKNFNSNEIKKNI